MEKELSSLLESIDSEIFNEDMTKKFTGLFEAAVEKRTADRVQLAVESATKLQDEEFTEKLKTYAEATDKAHFVMAKEMFDKLETQFKENTQTLVEKYETIIHKTAKDAQMTLVERIDDFFDTYLEKYIPREQVAEAAKTKYVENILSEARKVLAIDPSMVKENFKSALKEGKNTVLALEQEKNKLQKENELIKKATLLSEATINLPKDKAKFIVDRLKDKPLEMVKENIKFVSELYDREEQKKSRSSFQPTPSNRLVERARVASELVSENTVIQENSSINTPDSMDVYMEGLTYRR